MVRALKVTRLRLPVVRGDCLPGGVNECRPCPYASCRYHLPAGAESCALDVADAGEHTLEVIASYFGVTRERIRQIEQQAFERLREHDFEVPPEQPHTTWDAIAAEGDDFRNEKGDGYLEDEVRKAWQRMLRKMRAA